MSTDPDAAKTNERKEPSLAEDVQALLGWAEEVVTPQINRLFRLEQRVRLLEEAYLTRRHRGSHGSSGSPR